MVVAMVVTCGSSSSSSSVRSSSSRWRRTSGSSSRLNRGSSMPFGSDSRSSSSGSSNVASVEHPTAQLKDLLRRLSDSLLGIFFCILSLGTCQGRILTLRAIAAFIRSLVQKPFSISLCRRRVFRTKSLGDDLLDAPRTSHGPPLSLPQCRRDLSCRFAASWEAPGTHEHENLRKVQPIETDARTVPKHRGFSPGHFRDSFSAGCRDVHNLPGTERGYLGGWAVLQKEVQGLVMSSLVAFRKGFAFPGVFRFALMEMT